MIKSQRRWFPGGEECGLVSSWTSNLLESLKSTCLPTVTRSEVNVVGAGQSDFSHPNSATASLTLFGAGRMLVSEGIS